MANSRGLESLKESERNGSNTGFTERVVQDVDVLFCCSSKVFQNYQKSFKQSKKRNQCYDVWKLLSFRDGRIR